MLISDQHWVWVKANTSRPECFEGSFRLVDTMRARGFQVNDEATYGRAMVFANPTTGEEVVFIQTEVQP